MNSQQHQLYLIQQTGLPRVAFGVSPDAQEAYMKLQETFPGRLQLVGVVKCRNARAAGQVQTMLRDRFKAHQDGDWYTLPPEQLVSFVFWFQVLSLAVSTARERFYQIPGLPKKRYPRSQFSKAVVWLKENDPECTLPCRVVAAQAGVSTGTANNAARYLLSLHEAG